MTREKRNPDSATLRKVTIALAKILGVLVVAVATSAGTSRLKHNSDEEAQAVESRRLGIVETQQTQLMKDIVPRAEHEAHWDATKQQLDQIQTDIRELRRTILQRSNP